MLKLASFHVQLCIGSMVIELCLIHYLPIYLNTITQYPIKNKMNNSQ